jgi:acyl-CoA thioesterase-1
LSWKRACYASAVAIVYLLGGCSPEGQPANRTEASAPAPAAASKPTADSKLVLAFGDSLYAGYGLAPSESFPAQLEAALRKRGIAASVRNAGVSGDTSAAGLERLQFTLGGLPRTPDLAIVGLGGNDMLRGLDPEAMQRNLLSICEQLRKRDIPVILTGMLAAPNLGQDYVGKFNGAFPAVAKQCGASLYPFFLQDVVTDAKLMLGDRIHPNSAGIARIVEKIEPMVASALTKEP